jgi:hypothetical protein
LSGADSPGCCPRDPAARPQQSARPRRERAKYSCPQAKLVINNEASGAQAGTPRDAIRPDRTRRLWSRPGSAHSRPGRASRSGGTGTLADSRCRRTRDRTPRATETPPEGLPEGPSPSRHRRNRATRVSRPASTVSPREGRPKAPSARDRRPRAAITDDRRPRAATAHDRRPRAAIASRTGRHDLAVAAGPAREGETSRFLPRRQRPPSGWTRPSVPDWQSRERSPLCLSPKPSTDHRRADRRNRARQIFGTAASALSRCPQSIARAGAGVHRDSRRESRFVCVKFQWPHIASTPYPRGHPQPAAGSARHQARP